MEDLVPDRSSHKNQSTISSQRILGKKTNHGTARLPPAKQVVSSPWRNKYYWFATACAGASMFGFFAMMAKLRKRG
jgi:hypothetical protein